jgi:hypothetical protein
MSKKISRTHEGFPRPPPRRSIARASNLIDHTYRKLSLPPARRTVAAALYASTVGGGPSYQKCGRAPLYPVTELDRWACERLGALVRSSSDPAVSGTHVGEAAA